MTENLATVVEEVFENLIESQEVQLIREDGELHIAGDAWTIVLDGDPVTAVLVALDEEDNDPGEALRDALSEPAFVALRQLDARLDGDLAQHLQDSPDLLANALAELLRS